MIVLLIALGKVTHFGITRLIADERVRTVLGKADAHVGVIAVEFFKPREILRDVALIPAEVVVVGADVRRLDKGIRRREHRDMRHDRGTGRIEGCGEFLELLVGGNDLVRHAAQGDLIGERPANNARVVIILRNELFELRENVFAALGHAFGDVRDLRPDDEAVLIAQFVEIVVVLIMSKTHGIGAELQNEGDVLLVFAPPDGIAHARPVLMAGDAAQGTDAPVEKEALLGIEGDGAQPEGMRKAGNFSAVLQKDRRERVEAGTLDPLPKVRLLDLKEDFPLCRRPRGGDDLTLFVRDRPVDGTALGREDVGNTGDLPAVLLKGRDLDAAADGREVEAGDVLDGEDDVAVDAAEEGEVGGLRIDVIAHRIVGDDLEHGALPLGEIGRDVELESRIAALVTADEGFIEIDGGRLVDAVEGEKDALVLRVVDGGKFKCIGAGAAEVVVFAVRAVKSIPGVRERDGLRHLARLCKQPALFEHAPHRSTLPVPSPWASASTSSAVERL